ncbi:MAG: DUF2391 family protein [Bdellovibrionales bacterium]|nr:DUF2391 family protein [Bdellovibrionales bacterium]
MDKQLFKSEIKRVNGYLKEIVTHFDHTGNPISTIVNPLTVELKPRDVLQIFVGSFLIAAPLSFTAEIWELSTTIETFKVWLLVIISFVTVTLFIYFNSYRGRMRGYILHFFKRIIATYVITASSSALILYLIDQFPFGTDPGVAMKRVIIISFPALFGAILSDTLK